MRIYKPETAVLITPIGVGMGDGEWDAAQMIDSAKFGDVLGSVWKIGAKGRDDLQVFRDPNTVNYAQTIGDRLTDMGMVAMGDERGVINHQKMQFSSGLEVTITDRKMQRRLGVNSGIGVMSLKNVREPEVRCPLILGQNGEAREISRGGNV